jgi:serine/threonine protein kinase
MEDLTGKTISHYLILDRLGAGGMGVVYKAEDTKLKRTVALKFLTPQALGSEEEKSRFVHEAQAAAALDHPNICTVHEIDETEGQTFIAMACIDGPTLKERVQAGPLKLDEVLDIGIQVAEGLREAHEKEIVHRDIKPGNIKVTEKGQAKIMDFGLAKLKGATKLTTTGTTLGTVAYMSPEQAKGEEVDHRADIWSLGVVLYEMVTGQLPFKSEYEQAVVYSIMNEDPEPLTGLRTGVPMELERIVSKALEKKKEDRYQHVEDMLIDLRRLKRDTSEVLPKSMKALTIKGRKLRTTRLILGGFAAVAIIFILISIFFNKFIKREPTTQIQPTHRQITFTGKVSYPSISPDGKFIAFASEVSAAEEKVFVQELTGGQPLEIFKDKGIVHLGWSPDGSELLISAYNDSVYGSYIVPRLGGTSRKMTYFPFTSWSPDGSRFAGSWLPQKRIWFTNKSTGDITSISLDGSFTWLRDVDWSPVGDLLLFLTSGQEQYTIWTIRTDGTQQHKIVEDSARLSSPRWSSKGDAIYYLRSHGQTMDLMKIKIAPSTVKAKESAQAIQTGLQAGDFFTLSKDNKQLLYTRAQNYSNLWLASYEDNQIRAKQLTTGTSLVFYSNISPDGKMVAFSRGNLLQSNIFVMPLEGGKIQQLTFFNSFCDGPAWSPDGKKIAFGSRQGGIPRVWIVKSSGGTPRPFQKTELSGDDFFLVWSPCTNILYHWLGNRNFHLLNPETEEEWPLVANDSVGWMFYPCYSPDCRKVAVRWNRKIPPKPGIWLISLEDSSQIFLQPTYSRPIGWSEAGNLIYYSNYLQPGWFFDILSPEILMIPVSGGKEKTFMALPFENITNIRMLPSGKKFVCSVIETQSDVWLMENFDPEVK